MLILETYKHHCNDKSKWLFRAELQYLFDYQFWYSMVTKKRVFMVSNII